MGFNFENNWFCIDCWNMIQNYNFDESDKYLLNKNEKKYTIQGL